MKSERRHDLDQNVLLKWIDSGFTTIKPYTNAILGVLLLMVVIVLGLWMWNKKVSARETIAWDDLIMALPSGNPSDLNEVIEKHSGTRVAQSASLIVADMQLSQGCDELFSNRESASDTLRKARDHYQKVLDESSESSLREQATYGLARAYESLAGTRQSQGELDLAIKQYEELLENWPEGPFASLATNRLEALNTIEIKKFYDQFAKYVPQPAIEGPGSYDDSTRFDPDAIDRLDAAARSKMPLDPTSSTDPE